VSQSGSQAAAFFREITTSGVVWFVRDDRGSPTPKRVMPYWSSQARAQRAATIWGGGFRPAAIPLEAWCDKDLPDLAAEGCRVGINWTGPRLVGWDFTVAEVVNRLAYGEGGITRS
jgi:hypothetical protein